MASPEARIGLGLATAAVVVGIYSKQMPSSADIRVGKPGEENLESVRKQTAWIAAGTVAGISLLAKDPTIFIMVVAHDVLARVNNFTNPVTGGVIENPFSAETTAEPVAEMNYSESLYAVP